MTTTDDKPYTDEDVDLLHAEIKALTHLERRLLATLDERTRERDEAREDAARDGGLEAMAREEAERMLRSASDLRDALDSVAGALGVDTSTDADTEARACVAAVAALRERLSVVERERDEAVRRCVGCVTREEEGVREVASLREEVAQLRGDLADSERAREGLRTDLRGAQQQIRAAERRAEEARVVVQRIYDRCRRGVESSTRRASILRGVLLAALLDAEAALGILAATLPPQQQTPAPDDEEHRYCDHATPADMSPCDDWLDGKHCSPRTDEVERLRSRVRELEGRLSAGVTRARWVRDASRGTSNERSAIDALLGWGGDTERWLAALPSQEQPAAPPTSTPEAPRANECIGAVPAIDAQPYSEPEAPSTPEGEPGYDLPPDAPEIPEGEPADDDADPTKWRPGDVVAFVLRSDDGEWRRDSPEYTLQTRVTVGWECWFKDWRVRHKTIYDSDVRRLIESGERRRYRRIRRASTEERRG